MSNPTIEQKAAAAILQKPVVLEVNGKRYEAAQPSTATLILVSEAISLLPGFKLDKENIVPETLAVAKDCRVLGDIMAVLILGAKHIGDKVKVRQIQEKRGFLGLYRRRVTVEVERSRKEETARELLEDLTPAELASLASQMLNRMEIGDFFAITTFLGGVNLLHPTKVETEATASGQ